MDFKVLAVGDVVGNPGMDRVCRSLRYLKRKTGADFVIVNGENAAAVAHYLGNSPKQLAVAVCVQAHGRRKIADAKLF